MVLQSHTPAHRGPFPGSGRILVAEAGGLAGRSGSHFVAADALVGLGEGVPSHHSSITPPSNAAADGKPLVDLSSDEDVDRAPHPARRTNILTEQERRIFEWTNEESTAPVPTGHGTNDPADDADSDDDFFFQNQPAFAAPAAALADHHLNASGLQHPQLPTNHGRHAAPIGTNNRNAAKIIESIGERYELEGEGEDASFQMVLNASLNDTAQFEPSALLKELQNNVYTAGCDTYDNDNFPAPGQYRDPVSLNWISDPVQYSGNIYSRATVEAIRQDARKRGLDHV